MKNDQFLFALLLTLLLATGCAWIPSGGATAQARVEPTAGQNVRGTVTFTQQNELIQVVASFSGLKPGGHGFHIHEKGDCSAPDGTSAGGHFNPGGKKHGLPGSGEHHVGDLPMLQADQNGKASLTTSLSWLSLGNGDSGIIGRAVVVHAAPDDFKSQPAGNSGARLACGVIVKR